MGIAVSKDKLRRPYKTLPTQEKDIESNQYSIRVEVPPSNGMPAIGLSSFDSKRWGKVFGGAGQHRYAPK